tara:strand:- start:727 stop:975 length:249 start_codon:yes stop_codon:yes gene_type:complete
MNKTKIRYDRQIPRIVKDKVIIEEIIFQGKKIKTEITVKEWNIPDIITEDIGYQLMFGNRPTSNRKASISDLEEVEININLK